MKRRIFIQQSSVSALGILAVKPLFNHRNLAKMKVTKPYKRNKNVTNVRALKGGGAIISFLATSEDTNGSFALFEAKGMAGMEPAPHIHEHEDETYYILEGELYFKVGDQEFTAKEGDFVYLPRKVKHEFKVLSETFRCQVAVYPAGLDEYFMELSDPYNSLEIPPLSTTPPSPEMMQYIIELNKKFGISQ